MDDLRLNEVITHLVYAREQIEIALIALDKVDKVSSSENQILGQKTTLIYDELRKFHRKTSEKGA